MGFRGSSLSYSAPPFPSPVPTAATATTATTTTSTSSLSSSTLSPLAPPFTVERTFSKPPLTYDAYASPRTPWPQPSDDNSLRHQPPDPPLPIGSFPAHAYEVVRPHRRPTIVPDIARDGAVNGVGEKNLNLVQAEPYFPRSNSIEAASGGDLSRDRSDSGSGYLGALTSVLDFPFGEGAPEENVIQASSWMDPEGSSGAPVFGPSVGQDVSTAPGFAGYEELQGDWHVKNSESTGKNLLKYEDYGCSGTTNNTAAQYAEFTPSAGMCYPHLSDVNTFMKGSKISDSDSLYERYFCEASRERTDSGKLYSASTMFPANILASSSITSTTNSLEHVSHADHVNSQNCVPHRGQIFFKAVGPSINSKFEHKEEYTGPNVKEGKLLVDVASLNPTVVKITSPLSIEASKQIPGDITMGKKSELRITSPHLPCSIECNHDQSFSERLDDHSAEDSPCWKGMPSSRFSVLNTSDAFADCGLERQKFDTPSKRDCPKLENEGAVLHSYGLREDSNVFITLKDHGHDFGPKNENVRQTANERKNIAPDKNEVIAGVINHGTQLTWGRGDSSASFSLADTQLSLATKSVDNASNDRINPAVVTDPLERNLTLGIDVQLLVKSIHNLSELLLSSCRFDASLLKEQDRKLLSSAVNNLEVCTSDKHEPEISGPGLLHKSGTYFCRQFPVLSELSMDEQICGKGENRQEAYDESLWTNVEDALLLLKSRIKILKSNIMVDKCKQRTKDAYFEASDVTRSVSQNYPGDIAREIMLPWKSTDTPSTEITAEDKQETLNNPLENSPTVKSKSKRAEVDASVMAKFNILKHRNDSLNLANGQEQHGYLTSPGVMSNHPSLPEGRLDCQVQIQPVKDARPTGWESQQPFHSSRTEDASSERGSCARPRQMAVGHSHMPSPLPEQKVAEGFYAQSICTSDRRSAKRLMTGIDGSSSDWEHVLEEEDATW